MKTDILRQIVDNKNEAAERQVVRTAEILIEEIVQLQRRKSEADARILELRAELKTLEFTALDPLNVLGE